MTSIEDRVAALRTAAGAGDPDAALELGRLLCLLPLDPADPAAESVDDENYTTQWPGVPWLRASLAARPGDVSAATLLAGQLVRQVDHWMNLLEVNPGYAAETADGDHTAADRAREAHALYSRVLDSVPSHPVASAGLMELDALTRRSAAARDASQDYDYYLAQMADTSGSVSYTQSLVTTDPDELRWACDRWMEIVGGPSTVGFQAFALSVFSRGQEVHTIDLGPHTARSIDWDAFAVPPLAGPLLPSGHPAQGGQAHYGYSARVE